LWISYYRENIQGDIVMAIREKYSHRIADAKKAKKRTEAEARQKTSDNISNAEQIAKLDAGGYRAIKERAKLKGLL